MTPPVLALPHNWTAAVVREQRWSTDVLAARDGSEQRLQRATAPATTLRYTVGAREVADAGAWLATLTEAATADDRLQVRVPRWEDACVLASAADAGATTLTLASDRDATLRAFADDGAVWLWWNGASEVATLAASGSVASAALTLASGLAADWPAGTQVVPLSVGRLAVTTDLTRMRAAAGGALADMEWIVELEPDVAGATATSGGDAATPVVATMTIHCPNAFAGSATFYEGTQLQLRADCFDAAGASIPAPANLVWTTDEPTLVRVLPSGTPGLANVELLGGAPAVSNAAHITATDPATSVADTFTVNSFANT